LSSSFKNIELFSGEHCEDKIPRYNFHSIGQLAQLLLGSNALLSEDGCSAVIIVHSILEQLIF